MTTKVTEQGLLIPKELVEDMDEVEIRKEQNFIIITPVGAQDPIFEFGRDPIDCDITDASINHDRYLQN